MRPHSLLPVFALACAVGTLALAPFARAGDAHSFIEQEHAKLMQLLRQPPSGSRDAEVDRALDDFVEYEELTHRAFGEPCPAAIPSCEDLWAKYDEKQKHELSDLLAQLVRKSYRRNLTKTLDYDVSYRGSRDSGEDTRVLTEAKSKSNAHEPAVRVDYVVKQTSHGYRVVDIVTEGSSLTKNYYEQFRKKMDNPNDGYQNIVQKLREKITKKD
jgi:ABC-type transporter MlaC component